jgi:integrase
LGLRWQDTDLLAKTATIRQTFYRLGKHSGFKVPKTQGSQRAVHLPGAVVDALQQLQADQREAQRLLGAGDAADLDLVFCQPNGQPIQSHNLTQRDFRRVIRRAGLPVIRFHDLRHAHASYLALAGVPPKVAQERLGHATPTFTMRVYTHTLAGQQERAAQAVEALLLGRDGRGPESDALITEPDQARTERRG